MDKVVNNDYLEFIFDIKPTGELSMQIGKDLLIAALGEVGFESFMENPGGVAAYIPEMEYHKEQLTAVDFLNSDDFEISYSSTVIEQVNWNEEWEKNFDPILVEDRCSVRAPFHEKTQAQYDIVIAPKMSFGTGHHETTHLMIQHILQQDIEGKKVLDMGCGTGVLAILATLRGASATDAVDIDSWSYHNTLENIKYNHCEQIKVYQGDAKLLVNRSYDIVLANINRNILLEDIGTYVQCLNQAGDLFLSGFYAADLTSITAKCNDHGLQLVKHFENNRWVAAQYKKE